MVYVVLLFVLFVCACVMFLRVMYCVMLDGLVLCFCLCACVNMLVCRVFVFMVCLCMACFCV